MTETVRTEQDASVEQRDLDWLANVYRGDKEPDLTVRAIIAGMLFGGLMSLSNLYVGLKSGWGLDVGTAAIIVMFAFFKGMEALGLVRRQLGIMECTMTMTVAVAASWISSAGLVSAIPALSMLRPDYPLVWWKITLFVGVILYLGVIMSIPLKRQMIQVESLRFPGVIPTGETLKVMYAQGGQATTKAVSLGLAGLVGMLLVALREGWKLIPDPLVLPLRLYRISFSKLTLSIEPSLIFIGVGAMVGMKIGLSMLLGFLLNYVVLAPPLIERRIIEHAAPKIVAAAAPQFPLSVSAGQSLVLKLEEAASEPELPAESDPPAGPDGASLVNTQVLKYTWTAPKTYGDLDALIADLNAETLLDGSPNPLNGVLGVRRTNRQAKTSEFVGVLVLEATKARGWEARMSLLKDQAAETPHALGFKLAADLEQAKAAAEQASGAAAKAAAGEALAATQKALDDQNKAAKQSIGGFRNIVAWSLWPGATVLVVSGLLSLAFQWRSLRRTFGTIFSGLGAARNASRGPLDHVEVPMSWFVLGFIGVGSVTIALLAWVFAIPWWMGLIAVLLSFLLAAAASRAGAETSINPIGAMGKVTQLIYGVIAPGNSPASLTTNLMTAGVTAGAACGCCDTIGNLKVGHMVGANPRRQLIAQLFGIISGSLLAVPAYFILVPDPNAIGTDKLPAPSALVWKGVAEVLAEGLHKLPVSAVVAMGIALVVGIAIVVVDHLYPKLKPYTPSATALGIAMTIPAHTSLSMFLGALIAWFLEKKAPKLHDLYTVPIASGCIAGESIMAVVIATLMAVGVL